MRKGGGWDAERAVSELRSAGVQDDKDNPRLARVTVLLNAERLADVAAVLKEDGAVDEKAFVALVERQIAAGIHGLVPMGTTGEASTVSKSSSLRVES